MGGSTKFHLILKQFCPGLSLLRKIFILFLITFSLLSCKTPRSVIKEPIKNYGSDYLLKKLKENELKFDWLSAKYNLDLIIDKKQTSLNGQLRMRKDSCIWISLSPALGIEMARIMITEDSVKFINRINKTYFKGDYEDVEHLLNINIDYDVIQSILIGIDLTYYDNSKFRATYDSKEYHLVTAERSKLKKYVKNRQDADRIYIQNIFLDPSTFKITNMKLKELTRESKKLEASFTDFDDIGGQLFAKKIIFDITTDSQILVDLNYSKISLDSPLRFPFRITPKYSQIR